MQLVFAKMYVILKRYYSFFFFCTSLEKEGKMATRKEAKGTKGTSRKESKSKSPG